MTARKEAVALRNVVNTKRACILPKLPVGVDFLKKKTVNSLYIMTSNQAVLERVMGKFSSLLITWLGVLLLRISDYDVF